MTKIIAFSSILGALSMFALPAFAAESMVIRVTAKSSNQAYIELAASCNGDTRYTIDVSTYGGQAMLKVALAAKLAGTSVSYISTNSGSGKCSLDQLQMN